MIQPRRIALLTAGLLILVLTSALGPDTPLASGTDVAGAKRSGPPDLVRAGLLGSSGNLRALICTRSALEQDSLLRPLLSALPPDAAGVHALGLSAPDGDSLVFVSLAPLESLRDARLASYRVGHWPTEGRAARDARYAPPAGFIPVTRENQSTAVSKRFRLRDFLTHDQQDVWPKVLVLHVSLLDKLELVGAALERRGLPGSLHVMSGFRTPQYNARGVGAKGGRAAVSRHMYGDAADVFVDANADGMMDDLDGDGKIGIGDARVLLAVAAGVEADHPGLVGGLSAYPANRAHGPFVHIDTRGVQARW